MSLFVVLPVIVGVFWLFHASLGIAGSSAYRYTRWVLFGGLAVLAVCFFLAFVVAISEPEGPDTSEFRGGIEFLLTLETVLVGLGAALVEIFSAFVMTAVRVGRAEKCQRAGP